MQKSYKGVFYQILTVTKFAGLALLPAQAQTEIALVQQTTSVNEVELIVNNTGILGLDGSIMNSAGMWPRSAEKPGIYIFGSGVWFAAKVQTQNGPEKRVFKSYDPDNLSSWAAPGDVSDGANAQYDAASISKNRVYVSTDYGDDGQLLNNNSTNLSAPGWPLWNPDWQAIGPRYGNLGTYIPTPDARNLDVQNALPVYISDQDILCRYKSTDPRFYKQDAAVQSPMELQFEQAVYSWKNPEFENFVIVRHDITNVSDEALYDCYFAHAGDVDIGDALNIRMIPFNDRMASYPMLPELNMAAFWSESGLDVDNNDYGYFGLAMLQSPSLDENGFVDESADPADYTSQIGLTNVRDWVYEHNPRGAAQEYDFMAAGQIEQDLSASDRRMMFGSGAFNLRPGQTVRFVVGYFFAPSLGDMPDGSLHDVSHLIDEVNKGHQKWRSIAVSVGRPQLSVAPELQIMPNPVSEFLLLRTSDLPPAERAQVKVVDLAGRQLLTYSVPADELSAGLIEIDVTALPTGNFHCSVTMDGVLYSAPFVIVR